MERKYRIIAYRDKRQFEPLQAWLDSIKDKRSQRRIKLRIERMQYGNFGDYKSVGDQVYELRFFFSDGAGYRLFFGFDGDTIIVLLCGGDKSSQSKDIKKAKAYLEDYRRYPYEKI